MRSGPGACVVGVAMIENGEMAELFIVLGATLLLGLGADALGRRTKVPRVTLLILIGFLAGPGCFDVLPESREVIFQLAANLALTMVGFLLGEKLGVAARGPMRKPVLWVSVMVVAVTAAVIFGGLLLAGAGAAVALLLAGIGTATDPAATIDVVRERGKVGRFESVLLAVVAVDDGWGLLVFSLALAGVGLMGGDSGGAAEVLKGVGLEIGGSVLLGVVLGVVMSYLTGRIAKGEPTILEAVGLVLLSCGLALWFEVSFILTAMVMGLVVSVLARHHERPFHVIAHLELPFMIVFFVLAGASLELGAMAQIGWLGLGYVLLRVVGRVLGGWLGALVAGEEVLMRRWIGVALMPQAGVALGMALVAAERSPEYGMTVLQVAIGATVVFELIGPVLTGVALRKAGGDDLLVS